MSSKLTVCITETLQRLIKVDVDEIDCDAIEYVRQQYLVTIIGSLFFC